MDVRLLAILTTEFEHADEILSSSGVLHQPLWDEPYPANDWRAQVPDELKHLWADLSLEARGAILFMALRVAQKMR